MAERLTTEERRELKALARFTDMSGGPTLTDRSNWYGVLGRLARRKLLIWGDPPSGFNKSQLACIRITDAGRAALKEASSHAD